MSVSASTAKTDPRLEQGPSVHARDSVQIVVTSPGSIDMHGLTGLSKAMQKPASVVSKLVYQAPSVLLEHVRSANAPALIESLEELGVKVAALPSGAPVTLDAERYDLALHIAAPEAIPAAVETVARLVGVQPDQAFRMISTPPGLILGGVSTAAMRAVEARLPDGCQLLAAKSGEGPYDVFVQHDAPQTPGLTALCGDQRGLLRLGLSASDAEEAFARLPKGTARLIARDLIACDVVLESANHLSQDAKAWLASEYDLHPEHYEHLPLALEEGLSLQNAETRIQAAERAGVELVAEPSGFELCAIKVMQAPNLTRLQELLTSSGYASVPSVPAVVATNLSDLDARWLAFQLEQVGAHYMFEEPQT